MAPRPRSALPTTKACARCGRTITWRKAWERDWDAVRWCSDASPSEVARAVAGGGSATDDGTESWRALMEPARMAARRLVAAGRAEVTQGGRVVDPSRATGPIRVRRPR